MNGHIDLGSGVTIFERGETYLSDYKGYDIAATVEYNGRRLEVTSLTVHKRENGAPVTGEALRMIPVAGILHEAAAAELIRARPSGTRVRALGALTEKDAKRLKNQGPTKETLTMVATVYRIAEVLGDPPTKAVRQTFDVSQSTAGSWIGRARAADLIPPVEDNG